MKIRIDIPHHPYDIQIEKGCLAQAGQWLRELWQPQKVVIVTDNHVASLYAEKVKLSLDDAGFQVAVFDFLEGEERKNLTTVQKVYEFLVKQGLTRSDGIVALGGGVVGDLAGFVASTYMRGIHFVQIPTSLTAQVDSSIGGKTGVNTPFAKNMVGTFAQPDGVLIDPLVLETLGKRELIEGMGEVIKYGLIEDPELWALLTELDGSVESILEHAETLIEHSCQVKRKMVVEDELDNGVRLYLNFGHTIGHALEALWLQRGQLLLHGYAVAYGLIVELYLSALKTGFPTDRLRQMQHFIRRYYGTLPLTCNDYPTLLSFMHHDKKNISTDIHFTLLADIGAPLIDQTATEEEIKDALDFYREG